jgi:hypothetical protein
MTLTEDRQRVLFQQTVLASLKGLSLDNRIGRKESMAEEKRNERLRKWR